MEKPTTPKQSIASPTLTIGIPVYNGAGGIRRTLDSVLSQVPRTECAEVEVLISDNASTDGTMMIVAEYARKFPVISFFRNDRNLGFDRNTELVVQQARGNYVWLLGCGDIANPGSIGLICGQLRSGEYTNALLNFSIYEEVRERIVEHNALSVCGDVRIESLTALLQKYASPFMAVSSNVVRRSDWLSATAFSLIDSGWAHMERILRIMSAPHPQMLIISSECFVLYREKGGWWTSQDVFFNFLKYNRILRGLSTACSVPALFRAVSRNSTYSLWASIDAGKRKGIRFHRELRAEVGHVFSLTGVRGLGARIIMRLPNWIFRVRLIGLLLYIALRVYRFTRHSLKLRKACA